MIMLLAVAAAAQWNVSDVISENTRAKQRAYEQCAVVTARRFSQSKDDANIIATAALAECKRKKQAYFASLNADAQATNGKPFGYKFLSIMDKRLDEKVRNEALLAVTKARSAR